MRKILIILFFLSGFAVQAQYDSLGVRQVLNAYGYDYKNLRARESFLPPSDTPFLRYADVGSIAVVNGVLYIWKTSKKWEALTGGAGSSAWGSITGSITDQADLQAALNLKANSTHTHDQSDITNLVSDLTGKAASVHTHAESDVTGLTAALAGKAATAHTHVISDVTSLQSTIDGKVADAINDGTTTIAPSQNAVFDAFTTSQFTRSPGQRIAQLLGSPVSFATLGKSQLDISVSSALADGSARYMVINITEAKTLTTVQFWQSVTGDYVANNYNGLALFSVSGTTLTLLGSTTDDGNIWKGTAATMVTKAFSSAIPVTPGLHVLYYLYNSSSQTTAPSIGAYTTLINNAVAGAGLTNSAKFSSLLTGQSAIVSPQLWSGLTANAFQLYGEVN